MRKDFAATGAMVASASNVPARRKRPTTCRAPLIWRTSDDLEVALQLPIGHRVLPLAPFPFARGGEMIDEVVAEPVARNFGALEDLGRRRQRTGRASDFLRADVGASDGRGGELHALFDAVQPGRDQ